MYFDEDIEAIREQLSNEYPKLKLTALLTVQKPETI